MKKNKSLGLVVVATIVAVVYHFLPADMQEQVIRQQQTSEQISVEQISAEQIPVERIPVDSSYAATGTAQQKYTTTDVGSFNAADVASAFLHKQSDVQVRGQGEVIKLLPDDSKGSRHQRFIVRVNGNLTILIAHNIDLAPRLNSLVRGDNISFYGEYEWNDKGGVVHWTHRDPRSRHAAGWINHKGVTYQ